MKPAGVGRPHWGGVEGCGLVMLEEGGAVGTTSRSRAEGQ